MNDVRDCLTEWRRAERQRDGLPEGGEDWARADLEVRHARLVYRATLARTAAVYAESAEPAPLSWWHVAGSIGKSIGR